MSKPASDSSVGLNWAFGMAMLAATRLWDQITFDGTMKVIGVGAGTLLTVVSLLTGIRAFWRGRKPPVPQNELDLMRAHSLGCPAECEFGKRMRAEIESLSKRNRQ